jgi:hypothetical protein
MLIPQGVAMHVLVEPEPIRLWDDDDLEWPVLPPTLLTIHRTAQYDEQSRQIICRLDGERVVELLFGHTFTTEIFPGQHTLHVHNTLMWRSLAFEALPGGHAHFTVANRAGRGYYFLLLVLGFAPLFLSVEPGLPPTS